MTKQVNAVPDQDLVDEARARRRILDQEAEDDMVCPSPHTPSQSAIGELAASALTQHLQIYGLDTMTVRNGTTNQTPTASSWKALAEQSGAGSFNDAESSRGTASQAGTSLSQFSGSMAPSDNRRFARVRAVRFILPLMAIFSIDDGGR